MSLKESLSAFAVSVIEKHSIPWRVEVIELAAMDGPEERAERYTRHDDRKRQDHE